MDFLYTFGPTAIGIIASLSIAAYCWKRVRAASLTVIAWFAVSLGVSQFAFFPESQASELEALIRFTIFGTFAFGPAAVLIFMSLKITKFKSALEKIPTSVLVLTQGYRIGGVFLILAFLRGDLPAEIGLVSGFMDVTVAITAVALVFMMRRNKSVSPRLVIAWAVFSLADFGWATIVKFATFFGVLELSTTSSMLGNPPLAIISLFALPLGIFVSVSVALRAQKELTLMRPDN